MNELCRCRAGERLPLWRGAWGVAVVAAGCNGTDTTQIVPMASPPPQQQNAAVRPSRERVSTADQTAAVPMSPSSAQTEAEPSEAGSSRAPPCGEAGQPCCEAGERACVAGLGCDVAGKTCEPCAAFEVLDHFPGYTFSGAYFVSADGRWVAGESGGEGVNGNATLWDRETGEVSVLGIPPGDGRSVASSVDAQGQTTVGYSINDQGRAQMILWEGRNPGVPLGDGHLFALSSSGRVATGARWREGYSWAFRWTPESEIEELSVPDGPRIVEGAGVSGDGSAIVGTLVEAATDDPLVGPRVLAMRWTEEQGPLALGTLEGGNWSNGDSVNEDGRVVVGVGGTGSGQQVFRWTEEAGLQAIAPRRRWDTNPAVDASGEVVVGQSYGRTFIWRAEANRAKLLRDVLGGVVPDAWELYNPSGVSKNGRVVVGYGRGPGRRVHSGAWAATLGPQCAQTDAPETVDPAACLSFRALPSPVGHGLSTPIALSADGRVAVGFGRSQNGAPTEAVGWDLASGTATRLTDLPYSRAIAVSSDGQAVAGYAETTDTSIEAFRWFEESGLEIVSGTEGSFGEVALGEGAESMVAVGPVPLGRPDEVISSRRDGVLNETLRGLAAAGHVQLPDPGSPATTRLSAISADGRVVVGSTLDVAFHAWEATAWTSERTLELGAIVAGGASRATAVSHDGSVIVGVSTSFALPPLGIRKRAGKEMSVVFRWIEGEGMTRVAAATSDDGWWPPQTNGNGTVVVGTSHGRAFLWDSDSGRSRALHNMLEGVLPEGWVLEGAVDISADGRTVLGQGRSPQQESRGWVVVLGDGCSWASL